jgi:hypothetical protein
LREVQVGASAVADVHGFAEAAFGVVPVEDDAVDDNCYSFDYYFYEAADEGPGLHPANQCIINFLLE